MQHDLVIAGGGPAGLAAAIHAARLGLSAVVLERQASPPDKACGEGLMPAGVRALAEMGVRLPPGSGLPFAGIRYLDGGWIAEGRFRGGHGLGLRRTALVEALAARAAAAGAELRHGCAVRSWERLGPDAVDVRTEQETLRCRLLVAADGLGSALRRSVDPRAARPPAARGRRFGIRRHYRIEPWTDLVEVHWADGREAYVTPTAPDCVGVAILGPGDGRRFDALLESFPALRARLESAPAIGPDKGAGPLRRRARRLHVPGAALVGDAAGYLDAITGEGITLALRTAQALVETFAAGLPMRAYDRRYRRVTARYYQLTGLLLGIARRPRLRRRLVRALARRPDVFDRLLAIDGDDLPLSALGARDLTRLLFA